MILSEEIHNVRPTIAVHSFNSLGWEPERYDSVSNVSEVDVILTSYKSVFICTDQSLQPQQLKVSIAPTSRLFWRLVLNYAFDVRLVFFFFFLALDLLFIGLTKEFIVVREVELYFNSHLSLLDSLLSLNL